MVVELPVVSKLNILHSSSEGRSYTTSCSHTITGDLVTDRSVRQVFTRVNQTFILWDIAPTMGVLISVDISRSSSASYAWSLSICFSSWGVLSHRLPLASFSLVYICGSSLKYILFTSLLKADMIISDFFEPPMPAILVLSNLCPSLISCCEHLTRTTTSLSLCRGVTGGQTAPSWKQNSTTEPA